MRFGGLGGQVEIQFQLAYIQPQVITTFNKWNCYRSERRGGVRVWPGGSYGKANLGAASGGGGLMFVVLHFYNGLWL